MREYLEEAIAKSGLNVKRTAASPPARQDLFEIDEASPLLEKEEADAFHSVVAKLLYASSWQHPTCCGVPQHTRIAKHETGSGEIEAAPRIHQRNLAFIYINIKDFLCHVRRFENPQT